MKRPVGFDTAAQDNYQDYARLPAAVDHAAVDHAAVDRAAAEQRDEQQTAGAVAQPGAGAGLAGTAPAHVKKPEFAARIAQAVAAASDFSRSAALEHPDAGQGQEASAAAAVTPVEDLTAAQKQQKARIKQARRRLARAERAKSRAFRFWQRQLTANRRRQLRRAGIGATVVALLGVLVGIAVLTPALAVKEIQVSGGSEQLNGAVTEALQPLQGKPLAFVKDTEVHEALQQFTVIQDYDVQRVPPGQLVVHVTERTAVLALARGEKFAVVDAAGVELAVVDSAPEGLPLAAGDGMAKVGTKQFFAAAAVLRDIPPELRAQIAEVSAAGAQGVEFKMRDGVLVRWGGAQDTPLKAVIYSKMAAALAEQEISVIDVSATEAPVYR